MQKQYFKERSWCLDREMEFNVYGSAGKPVLYIPCQNGRFSDFEDFGMADALSPRIEDGQIQVFSCDTIDAETISNELGDPRWRIEKHEDWFHYIVDELVPRIHQINNRNGFLNAGPGIFSFGCSMGGYHAANFYFRRPDLFDRNLSLSAIYDLDHSFDGYHDDLTYDNSPDVFLRNMTDDHPWMERYRHGKCALCVGQGDWENETLESTRRMAEVVALRDLPVWVDFWGYDVYHDWPWWFKQVDYFMPWLLDEK